LAGENRTSWARAIQERHGQDRIFDEGELLDLGRQAEEEGLAVLGAPDLDVKELVIRSTGRAYTFAFLAFRRES
jgi:hypothetical protein